MPSDHLPVWAYVYWLLPICSYHDPAAYDNGGYHYNSSVYHNNNPAYYNNGNHYHHYHDYCSGFLSVQTASGWVLSGL